MKTFSPDEHIYWSRFRTTISTYFSQNQKAAKAIVENVVISVASMEEPWNKYLSTPEKAGIMYLQLAERNQPSLGISISFPFHITNKHLSKQELLKD